ncbi:hypothetical protein PR048_006230 [Dryococelus australis]|uniref:Uncharacterized protein n=1 Tax=Dryococelus australis TaxID=614101 RepID=A0ABQ9IAD7_9NEOP|nr:hypothetical protein PR048_006230 [Dryococelus australis]
MKVGVKQLFPRERCTNRQTERNYHHQWWHVSGLDSVAAWPHLSRGSGGAVARALATHHGDQGFTPGFSHVGIVLDDAACRRVFSGYCRFPRPCIPAPLDPRMSCPGMTGTYGRVLPIRAGHDNLRSSIHFCDHAVSPPSSSARIVQRRRGRDLASCFGALGMMNTDQILAPRRPFVFDEAACPVSHSGDRGFDPEHRPSSSVPLNGFQNPPGGHGVAVGRLIASHLGEPGSHVGIIPDDAAGRRVFSGISHFPRPCIPVPYSTRFTLIGSQDLDVESRPHLLIHSSLWIRQWPRLVLCRRTTERGHQVGCRGGGPWSLQHATAVPPAPGGTKDRFSSRPAAFPAALQQGTDLEPLTCAMSHMRTHIRQQGALLAIGTSDDGYTSNVSAVLISGMLTPQQGGAPAWRRNTANCYFRSTGLLALQQTGADILMQLYRRFSKKDTSILADSVLLSSSKRFVILTRRHPYRPKEKNALPGCWTMEGLQYPLYLWTTTVYLYSPYFCFSRCFHTGNIATGLRLSPTSRVELPPCGANIAAILVTWIVTVRSERQRAASMHQRRRCSRNWVRDKRETENRAPSGRDGLPRLPMKSQNTRGSTNREPFKARTTSLLDIRLVLRASWSQSENVYAHVKRTTTPFRLCVLIYSNELGRGRERRGREWSERANIFPKGDDEGRKQNKIIPAARRRSGRSQTEIQSALLILWVDEEERIVV